MANINIYGELHNDTPEGYVTPSQQIMDTELGKRQDQINRELVDEVRDMGLETAYLTCSTPGNTWKKTISAPDFALSTNVRLLIKMEHAHTSPNSPTLNINETGEYTIQYGGRGASNINSWTDNEVLDVYFDGTQYIARGAENRTGYLVCNTLADTAAKTVDCPAFNLNTYVRVLVKMTYTNTASNPTLNINGTGAKGIIYNGVAVSSENVWKASEVLDVYYDGTNFIARPYLNVDNEPTAGSNNLVKSGGVQNELALGAVYDVSAKNPTAGPNNDGKWESLSALLSDANLNTLIPIAVRKGGMSIKFVQSSDNNYVQYLCKSQIFTVNIFYWEKMNLEGLVNKINTNLNSKTVAGNIADSYYSVQIQTIPAGSVVKNESIGTDPSLTLWEARDTFPNYLVIGYGETITTTFDINWVKSNGSAVQYKLKVAGHLDNYNNPHQVTKAQIGLGNVDNISLSKQIAGLEYSGTIANANTYAPDLETPFSKGDYIRNDGEIDVYLWEEKDNTSKWYMLVPRGSRIIIGADVKYIKSASQGGNYKITRSGLILPKNIIWGYLPKTYENSQLEFVIPVGSYIKNSGEISLVLWEEKDNTLKGYTSIEPGNNIIIEHNVTWIKSNNITGKYKLEIAYCDEYDLEFHSGQINSSYGYSDLVVDIPSGYKLINIGNIPLTVWNERDNIELGYTVLPVSGSIILSHPVHLIKGNGQTGTFKFISCSDAEFEYDYLFPETETGIFDGKRIAIVGDSISTFIGALPKGWVTYYPISEVNNIDYCYWKKAASILSTQIVNCAFSASKCSGNSQSQSVAYTEQSSTISISGVGTQVVFDNLNISGSKFLLFEISGTAKINNSWLYINSASGTSILNISGNGMFQIDPLGTDITSIGINVQSVQTEGSMTIKMTVLGSFSECAGCSDARITAIGRNGTPDVVFVYLGINDWGGNVPIGDWDGSSAIPQEGIITTFSDAYALMLYKIQTAYPTTKIMCCTLMPDNMRDADHVYPPVNTSGVSLETYNNKIRQIANALGAEICEMSACGINWANKGTYYWEHQLHPNAAGHKRMAEKMIADLKAKYIFL